MRTRWVTPSSSEALEVTSLHGLPAVCSEVQHRPSRGLSLSLSLETSETFQTSG